MLQYKKTNITKLKSNNYFITMLCNEVEIGVID